ncbi:bacteriohemerythrin [Gracilinema caldarium]|uniref:Hemerythrin-like metal-binding protein n=1 Tax=Gracilinema caldarium (strain ATCC 51460 / DSM 7334 / H1) TaxID=744872 RepID=F8F2M8_GRAC1|nr:bacteriohemerythrin [Gracilinema caldarium]AEJ19143.1 hemerythrin-like metal-binding protein [Gracilinema caldarium DSM 7334]
MNERTLIEWNERYSVGIPLIDDQHQRLVQMANELYEGCTQGEEAARAYFGSVIKKAVAYVKDHFATEERMLQEAGYPDYQNHKKQHEAFIRTILEEVKAFQEGRKFVPNHFARYLRDWTLEHIAVSDQSYKEFMSGNKRW